MQSSSSFKCIKASLASHPDPPLGPPNTSRLCKLHDVTYLPGNLTWVRGPASTATDAPPVGSVTLHVPQGGDWLPASVSWFVGSTPLRMDIRYVSTYGGGGAEVQEMYDLVVVWIRGLNNLCESSARLSQNSFHES